MTHAETIHLDSLPIDSGLKKRINKSIGSYKASGIDIEIVDQDGLSITVVISQRRLVNGFILNNKQLYDRAKEVFEGVDLKVKIRPGVYSPDLADVTPEWVEAKMVEFGISRQDLIRQLAIDKSSLSSIFSGGRGFTKFTKAAFFYYFLTYELNRDLRE